MLRAVNDPSNTDKNITVDQKLQRQSGVAINGHKANNQGFEDVFENPRSSLINNNNSNVDQGGVKITICNKVYQ